MRTICAVLGIFGLCFAVGLGGLALVVEPNASMVPEAFLPPPAPRRVDLDAAQVPEAFLPPPVRHLEIPDFQFVLEDKTKVLPKDFFGEGRVFEDAFLASFETTVKGTQAPQEIKDALISEAEKLANTGELRTIMVQHVVREIPIEKLRGLKNIDEIPTSVATKAAQSVGKLLAIRASERVVKGWGLKKA